MIDVEQLTLNYFESDEPCPYELGYDKGRFVKIHPIRVADFHKYNTSKQVFEIRKNEINNFEIVTMSYLKFLDKFIFVEEEMQVYFWEFLQLILGLKLNPQKDTIQILYNESEKAFVRIESEELTCTITSKELDEIVQIAFYQNDPSYYDTSEMNPELRKDLEEYYKITCANGHNPTLEKQKIFVMSKMGYSVDTINKLTYRRFILLYKMLVDNDMFFAQTMYKVSDKYDVKENISHPTMTNTTFKDRINEAFTTTDAIEDKLNKIQ